MPGNDVLASSGNEANTTTNPDTVNEYSMVDFTSQSSLSQAGGVPTPSNLTAEGTSRAWLAGTTDNLRLGLFAEQPFGVVFGYFGLA